MVSGFLYRAETDQGTCTSPFVLSGGTSFFHATLFSRTPSRTKCWRTLVCRLVCLSKQLDENVATLQLPSHGAAITVSAKEYVDYVGIKLKALFLAPWFRSSAVDSCSSSGVSWTYIVAPIAAQRGVGDVAVLPIWLSTSRRYIRAVFLLSCSVHEEEGSGHDVPAPGWEVRLAPLSPCEIRRVLCVF